MVLLSYQGVFQILYLSVFAQDLFWIDFTLLLLQRALGILKLFDLSFQESDLLIFLKDLRVELTKFSLKNFDLLFKHARIFFRLGQRSFRRSELVFDRFSLLNFYKRG